MVFICQCLILALSLFIGTHAAPAHGCATSVKETVPPPRGWTNNGPAPRDHVLHLRIGLPQPNFHVLESHLYEISDPDHERYGHHLSKEAVEALVAPATESIRLVNEWLTSYGISLSDLSRSPAKDWVIVKVPVIQAEKMLDTQYDVWTHDASGDSAVRTLAYSLPDDLHAHVDLIQPTTMFTRMKKQKTTFRWSKDQTASAPASESSMSQITASSGIKVDASCNKTVTITCLKQLYNAVGYKSSARNGNEIGITGYLGEFANMADLQQFYADQRPDAFNSTFKFLSVNGGQNSQNITRAGPEADLDVQFAFGLTFPTPGTFYSTAGMPPFIPDIGTTTDSNEPYITWLEFILGHPNPPQTISTSYGDDEQTVPPSFAKRSCNGFAQLGARGVSLMFSSGDGGVGDGDEDPTTQQCFTNDGRNATRFIPGFPASCPFVTAVGGTIHIPERAVEFSGGGFSDIFPRPSYQNGAVTRFFKTLPNNTYKGMFNPNGRAIPDVSAQGDNFKIFFRNEPVLIGGTSASSPTFAGFVSLLNDVRLSHGLPPLGFLNPFLYSKGKSGLNDVTVGNNPGCGTPGFNATKGWDPVTGLGTPNFGRLQELVLN